MEQYTIILDLDGTICNDFQWVPDSTQLAIKKARANGHQVILCTSRNKTMVQPYIINIGFDALITCSGARIESDKTLIRSYYFSNSELYLAINFLNNHSIDFFLETDDGFYAHKSCVERQRKRIHEQIPSTDYLHPDDMFLDLMQALDDENPPLTNKIVFFGSESNIQDVNVNLAQHFEVVPPGDIFYAKECGEILPRGYSKPEAISYYLRIKGLPKDKTLGIGNSILEKDMLDYVAISVAMGDADEALKEKVDYVTDNLIDDGIMNCFKHYNLV